MAQAFEVRLELSPVINPTGSLALDMAGGRLEGIVLTEWNACHSSTSRLNYCTTHAVDILPVAGWNQLETALNFNSHTSWTILNTTDINWH